MIEQERVETFFRQASMTAATYFHEAIEKIDDRFGEDYAQDHPELIGHFMRTAVADYHACIQAEQLHRIAEALDQMASFIQDLDSAIGDHARRISEEMTR